MNKRLSLKLWLIVSAFIEIYAVSPIYAGQDMDSPSGMIEKLNTEKRSLEKLQTQLQILETQENEEERTQETETQTNEEENTKQINKTPIVIKPNENIVLTKEIGEYEVPVYSIDATQVKIADILQALSASFGKSIIVDEDVDTAYLSSYVNISIQKSPLQDILEVVLGIRGLEFIQNEDSIYVITLSKLKEDVAFEYYRDKSVQLYQKAQLKYPNDHRVAKAYLELGNYYHDLGFNFLALQEYKIVLGKYKELQLVKEALFKTGRCYDSLKDHENARRVYFQFMYSYPKDPLVDEALLSIGDSFVEQGLYHKAVDVYERVISEYSGEDTACRAQFNLAKTHVKMGNYRGALQSFLQAREKYDSGQMRFEIEYHIGNCLYLLNEYQDAGSVLGNLLVSELGGEEGELMENASFLLGDCFYKQDNYLAAFQIFRRAVDTYSKNSKVPYGMYFMGKSLNAMNMTDSAIQTFRDGMQAYPDNDYAGKMALDIGNCYFERGDYNLAYHAFDNFVKQYPTSELMVEGMIGMSDALYHDKKYEEAIKSYLELLKTNDEEKVRQYAFKRIGDCYRFMGKLEQAIKAYLVGLDKEDAAPVAMLHADTSLDETALPKKF
ncbi:MAG: tetratricopeptide repeat protein [Planctomycetes bacterium]|nr:tetratricopeptide repeat protein [Planctomycetota bacterium]